MTIRIIFSLIVIAGILSATPNSVTVHENAGLLQPNRPFTISRVFSQGEITDFPRPSAHEAVLAAWQSNVMTRWPDGSVQHALISFFQSVSKSETAAILFVNSLTPCHLNSQAACDAAAPSQEQILNFNGGNWGASIEATQASLTQSASARAMIAAGAWRFWIKGPLVNQIIVEDQSTALNFDFGWKDRHWTNLLYSLTDSATSVYIGYTADLAPLPAVIKIDSEKIQLCAISGNTATICPKGRGYGVAGSVTAASDSTLDPSNPGSHTTTLTGPTASGLEGGTTSDHPLGDYILISGGTGCWSALNGYKQVGTIGISDSRKFWVPADTRSCSQPLTGTLTYSTVSSHSPNSPVRVEAYPAGSWMAAPSSTYRSLHPIFVVTQYSGWPGAKVDYILENIWTTKQQDQVYDLSIKSGSALSKVEYTKPGYLHTAQARWRKTFWVGTQPGDVTVDFNFPYMIDSRVIPNFDQSRNITSTTAVKDEVNAFNATDRGALGGFAEWTQSFGTPGGRPDIGLFPRWNMLYLYTFDQSLRSVVFGNADVSGYIPIHYRESASGRFYDGAHTVDAFAKAVSPDGRPQLCTNSVANSDGKDIIYPVGNYSNANWLPDVAHQASFAFVPYILTGDWYYLTEAYYWASYDTTFSTPGTCVYCRHDDWGFLNESATEPRGIAWGLRNLGHAAWIAPDGSPEKAEWTLKLNQNIGVLEGTYDIPSGTYANSAQSTWGKQTLRYNQPNPLHLQSRDANLSASNVYVSTNKVCKSSADWMPHLADTVISHLSELGFSQIRPLRNGIYDYLLNQLLGKVGNQYMSAVLEAPMVTKPSGSNCNDDGSNPFFTDYTSLTAAYLPSIVSGAKDAWNLRVQDSDFGYPQITYAAASYLPEVFGAQGQTAWNWIANEFAADGGLAAQNANPKWAIVPRSAVKVISPCDLDGNGVVNQDDVTIATNQVIRPSTCSTAALTKSGSCTVADVQIVIRAAQGLGCNATNIPKRTVNRLHR